MDGRSENRGLFKQGDIRNQERHVECRCVRDSIIGSVKDERATRLSCEFGGIMSENCPITRQFLSNGKSQQYFNGHQIQPERSDVNALIFTSHADGKRFYGNRGPSSPQLRPASERVHSRGTEFSMTSSAVYKVISVKIGVKIVE